MAVRRRGFQRSGARPNRGWASTIENVATVIPAASKVLLASFVPFASGVDETILRVVGGVMVSSDQSAAVEAQIGAVGLIIVTDVALAAGIASIPGPVTDAADDGWFVHQHFAQQSAAVADGPTSHWYPIDQKAKRILDGNGQAVAVVVENINAASGLSVVFQFRLLSQIRGTQ